MMDTEIGKYLNTRVPILTVVTGLLFLDVITEVKS
jgi:hypothetical protein